MVIEVMRVTVADYAGFCFGVERAMKIVSEATHSYKNVVTFGPLIHNPQVVQELENSGVNVVNELSSIESEMTVVIRTHGAAEAVVDELKKRARVVIDATCPFVKKAQAAACVLSAKVNATAVVGEMEHPEVQGIVSHIEGEFFVVSSLEEAKALPYRETYGVVAQTTQSETAYNEIVEVIRANCAKIEVAHTTCDATYSRQSMALALAAKVDLMMIVGGKNSANTTRLYHLCKDVCPKAYHIETVADITNEMFDNVKHVGVSAGASTPNKLVYKIRDYILRKANE